MPVIPLYETPVHPHAWHRVTAPGGYESWSFVAEDTRGLRIEISLFDGDPFNPAYRAAYTRYRRRPTRVAPPVPRDFPALRASLGEGKALLWQAAPALPAGAFAASVSPSEIRVGPCVARLNDGFDVGFDDTVTDGAAVIGAWRVRLESLAADLIFEPADAAPLAVVKLDSTDTAIQHFRISGPLRYAVRGTFKRPGAQKSVAFEGEGNIVHLFGTGPTRH